MNKGTTTSSIDSSRHEVECTGQGLVYGGYVVWTLVWLFSKITIFSSQPFLFGVCAVETVNHLKFPADAIGIYSQLIEKHCLKNFTLREKKDLRDPRNGETENPHQKETTVVAKTGWTLIKVDPN